jgi:hypothetical protein
MAQLMSINIYIFKAAINTAKFSYNPPNNNPTEKKRRRKDIIQWIL